VLLGIEGLNDKNEETNRQSEFDGVGNKLTNAVQQVRLLSNQVFLQSNALAAAKIKPLKERLIDCLNGMDKRILEALRNGGTQVDIQVEIAKLPELEGLSNDPEGAKYLRVHRKGGQFFTSDGRIFTEIVVGLNPSLIK